MWPGWKLGMSGKRTTTRDLTGLIAAGFQPQHTTQDEDLKELKDRREWTEMLTEVKGGMSRAAKVDLRTEAKVSWSPVTW